MDVWGWIVVYAIGLTLLQLLLYRFLLNRSDTLSDGTVLSGRDGEGRFDRFDRRRDSHSPDPSGDARRETLGRQADVDPAGNGGRRCPHCGAENESDTTFRRCWNCTQPIG